MNTATIIINILFFIAVLITVIIRRNKIDFAPEEIPKPEDESPVPKSISKITRWLIGEVVTWVVFNLVAIKHSQIVKQYQILYSERRKSPRLGGFAELVSGLQAMYLELAPGLLIFLNIVCFCFFLHIVRKKSIPAIITMTVFWILINIAIKFIAMAVVIALGIALLLWILSSKEEEDNKGSGGTGWVDRSNKPRDIGYGSDLERK